MPITERTWTLHAATQDSPFEVRGTIRFGRPDESFRVTVTYQSQTVVEEWTGTYNSALDKVVVHPADNVHWEFVGSERVIGRLTMYGMSWTTTVPDTMAAWVADPQDS